ncbi:NAD(P)-binding domain-containing protein [Microbacterium sp. zg.Y1090]|uniref:NADPH-dependent F420 reductase n=1 Tax=Microbacterium TaxID=33882 RepID=UPI00214C6050|nr:MULTISPECIES: NAD(P)-binding domain-containing protein [unclassified Microbacterium]MCR2812732.1 NAD(P)-binding domain-containing protein [Microbacterium sp. zg.Y1084]MCR2817474.1 NAD(P)-binding domain-containing protein [Microbacterium sp. zg.Y1090]MDL5485884.1 NAD(P)-binding domain-containing protein [Microbacterium sp. zg-Y1211]WIM29042.1 NAD(P)-binding domain-containing protein [Microbacterium sp. zg-Y1090]
MISDTSPPTLGILGFGKLGRTLAGLADRAGLTVKAAGSAQPVRLRMMRDALLPAVQLGWADEVAATSDLVILALPLSAVHDLPVAALAGKTVIDAMNHWREVDGDRDDWVEPARSTSEMVQSVLADSRVVKAFNHIAYRDLAPRRLPEDDPHRTAIAIAGDDGPATDAVAALVRRLGFAPVVIGPLAAGRLIEPGSPAFGSALPEAGLRQLLEAAARQQP